MVLDKVATEVSEKVQCAIKAKLNELEIYADVELPEYIMILVGNKKTKEQMNDDLRLFLGANTEKFTSWLQNVLQRLNTAAILQHTKPVKEKEKKKEEKKEKEKEKVVEEVVPKLGGEEKKKHKKKKDKSEKKKEKKEKKKKRDKEKSSKSHKSKEKDRSKSKSKSPLTEASNTLSTATTSEASASKLIKVKDEITSPKQVEAKTPLETISIKTTVQNENVISDDVVDLRPDAEDLALGLEDELPIKKPKSKGQEREVKTQQSSSLNKLTSLEIKVTNTDAEVPVAKAPVAKVPVAKVPVAKAPVAKVPVTKVVEDAPQMEVTTSSVHDRLGAPPGGSPSKRIINLREESTFPPKSTDGIGRVVSSAIASAVKSVGGAPEAKTGKKLEARVRPLLNSRIQTLEEVTDTVAPPPSRVVSKVGAVLKRSHPSDDSGDDQEPSAKKLSGIASKVEVTPRPRRTGASQANTALILRAVADAHKSVSRPGRRGKEEEKDDKKELFTRSYQERQGQRLSTSKEAKPATTKKFAITVPNAFLKDSIDKHLGTKRGKGGETFVKGTEMEEDLPAIEESLEAMEDSDIPQGKLLSDVKPLTLSKAMPMDMDDPTGSTRFIVTLDGLGNEVAQTDLRSRLSGRPVRTPSVDEEEFIEEVEVWEEEVEEMEGMTPQGEVAQTRVPPAGVTFAPKWKTKIDASNLFEKKEERCKFWPACKEGTGCPFIHPTKVCNTFPSCRFGDKCIYIHPNCKFDAACSKLNCPFTHTTARNLGLSAAPVVMKGKLAAPKTKIKCRYYPKCVDMNCPFMHPKQICRYGKSCQTPSCLFVHPDVTTGALLKWTAPKTTTAGATVGAPASTMAPAGTAMKSKVTLETV